MIFKLKNRFKKVSNLKSKKSEDFRKLKFFSFLCSKGNRDIAIIKLQKDTDLESYIHQDSESFKYKYINGSQLKNYTEGKF